MRRSVSVTRAAARCAAMAAAGAVAVSLYTFLAGGFRLQLGPLRISAAGWPAPLIQGGLWSVVAAGLFYRDAAVRGEWDSLPRAVQRFLTGPTAAVTRRLLWVAVSAGSLASLLVCYRIARQSIVIGSVAGGWTFGFIQPPGAAPVLAFAVASAVVMAMVAWSERSHRPEWQVVAAWMAVALGLQALLRALTPFSFAQIFASGEANAFYSVTQAYDAASVLAHFDTLRDSWPVHAQSNMPGKLMLVYALELVSVRPAVLAWLIVLISNLGGALLYLLVRDLSADRRTALYSLVFYLLVPGKLFFFPLLNTVTPVLALAWAVVVQRWLTTGRSLFAAAAGVVCYAVLFFDPLALVVGLLFVPLAARAVWRGPFTWTRLAADTGLGAGALVATHAMMWWISGFDLFDALRHISADAIGFNQQAARPYDIWVRQNVSDFLFAAGACQSILFCTAVIHGLHAAGWTRRALGSPIVLFSLAVAAMLTGLDLAGINRGEVIRLWIFLQCLFQVPAAYACAQLNDQRAVGLVVLPTVLQCALGASTIGFVLP